ncbi:MAG: tetratricopeptide repeat protein [Nitrospirota bacterium]|nr:tetratricopeptide repeat protein [Nitrospirota bacterium]
MIFFFCQINPVIWWRLKRPTYWGERLLFMFLIIPLLVVSCAAVPDSTILPTAKGGHAKAALPPQAYFHFMQGYMAEIANDPAQAMQEYELGLEFDPDSAFLFTRIARLHFVAGKMGKAVAMLDRVKVDQVRDASVLSQMATILAGAGQPERSISLYDRAIQQDPKKGDNYFAKGVLLLNLQRLDHAQRMFEDGLQRSPQSHTGYFYLGKIYQKQGRIEEAKKYFQEAITRTPTFDPAYQAYVELLEANNDLVAAINVYEQYLREVNPHKKKFRQELLRLLLQQKSFDRALEELEFMLEGDPNDVQTKVRRALVYAEMKETRRAIEELSALVQAHPTEFRVRDYLGLLYEQSKQNQKAIEAYQTNIDLEPTFFDSRIHMGFLLYRLKRYDEAIPHLQSAVDLNPGNPESHLLLGLTQLQSKQHQAATTTFERGLEYHPKHVDLRFNLGTSYDKLGRFQDVVRELEAVLELDPQHADALNYLGYSYADREVKVEQALELTQRAVALKPDNGYYVDSLGWALFKIGRLQDALKEILRAAELVKDDPVIFEHLGEIYLIQKDRARAKEAWIQSIQLDPANHKLVERFREVGFGEPPVVEGGPTSGKSQVSQYTP